MPDIKFKQPDGQIIEVEALIGDSVMMAASKAGVEGIEAECGGSGMCGTCHCYVDEATVENLPPPEKSESNILQWVIEPQANSRLSCQLVVTDILEGTLFEVPATQF